jgi:uncharacterized protein YcaQ
VFEYIRKVNCIQYDPINIVGQNSHLVLQSRVRNYKPALLDSLLYEDRKLVDGFDKQMSIYPVEDWPEFTYYRRAMAREYENSQNTVAAVKLLDKVKAEIKARGPLSSLELEDDTRMDWWLGGSIRAARIAMDILSYRGDTVVHHRVGTRRYFDLPERALPARLLKPRKPHASHEDYLDWHIFRRAGGIGLLHSKTTAEYGGLVGWQAGRVKAAVLRLLARGRLVPLSIRGLERSPYYIRSQDLLALDAAARPPKGKPGAAFIAPLDNLMWNRNLVMELFDFDYVWEVYIPEPKRRYGYYVMPVLVGDRFVARMDPAFDRATKTFEIKNWWWEKGVDKKDPIMLAAIQEALAAFAKYLGAAQIRMSPALKAQRELKRAVAAANGG